MKILFLLIPLLFIMACSSQNGNTTNKCQPFFEFNKVEHYFYNIDEEDIWKIDGKENKTKAEKQQLELLINYIPDNLSDTFTFESLENSGYIKTVLPADKFEQLHTIFCERQLKREEAMDCIPVFRDILIFRNNGRITGFAKICFSCNQSLIVGTTRDTDGFGASGEFKKLYELLH